MSNKIIFSFLHYFWFCLCICYNLNKLRCLIMTTNHQTLINGCGFPQDPDSGPQRRSDKAGNMAKELRICSCSHEGMLRIAAESIMRTRIYHLYLRKGNVRKMQIPKKHACIVVNRLSFAVCCLIAAVTAR